MRICPHPLSQPVFNIYWNTAILETHFENYWYRECSMLGNVYKDKSDEREDDSFEEQE